MKWVVFGVALAGVYPLGRFLRGRPELRFPLWTLVGLLPFLDLDSFDINILSFESYLGESRGFEVTILDLLLISLYVALPPGRHRSPFRVIRYLYFFAALLSLTQAQNPLFAAFSVWKLLRMYMLLAVVSRGCLDPRVPPVILKGMTLGVLCNLGMVVYQRYLLGMYQTPGFFAHQNSLGMAVNMVAPVSLALLLAGARGWLPAVGVAAGAVVVVMSLSRGAMATFVAASGLLFLVSLARRITARKFVVALVAVTAGGALLIKAGHTIIERFERAPKESAGQRVQFEEAAAMMLADHPLGIGINQYSLVLNEGYWSRVTGGAQQRERPGVRYSGIVHNIYWLTAAELGYLGLTFFLILLALPLYLAFRHGWRARGDIRGDVLLGIGTGLLALYLQGLLEWAFRQTGISYLFWVMLAIVAALVDQLRGRSSREIRA